CSVRHSAEHETASTLGFLCLAGAAAGSRPGGRVTFFAGSKKVTKERAFFIWPNFSVAKSSPLTQTDDGSPSPRPSFALRASYPLQAACSAWHGGKRESRIRRPSGEA